MRIDGKKIAADLQRDLADRTAALKAAGVVPTIGIVVATDDDSAAWYVRSLVRTAERVGIEARTTELGPDAGRDQIRAALAAFSADPSVHGVLCQTPLPRGMRLEDVADAIDPSVDVDGANPVSLGRLAAGSTTVFPPATAAAVLRIVRHEGVPLKGKRAIVIGRSNIVGKPAALLLLDQHATVTVCHSRTVDLPSEAKRADVLVVAVGRPGLVTRDFVKPGALVIDVGTNPTLDGGLVGDVDTTDVEPVAGAVTPVPGGVGPVTTMVLMGHVVAATERRARDTASADSPS